MGKWLVVLAVTVIVAAIFLPRLLAWMRMGRLPGEQGYRIQGRLREDITGLLGSAMSVPGPFPHHV